VKVDARLGLEDRVLEQWRAASGCPISDEAKTLFCVHALGDSFQLGDVRLWYDQHPGRATSSIFLEFFFDGAPDDIKEDAGLFIKAFETMIEDTLRERRVAEFRKRAKARRRVVGRVKSKDSDDEACEGGRSPEDSGDEEWRKYLQSMPATTELSVKSIREAGCTLRFLVCQTSLSVSAAEELGQIAFPEHFPINGVAQVVAPGTQPLPRWFYFLAVGSALVSTVAIFAWWQIIKGFLFPAEA
jgi:hypothetical protein